MTEARPCWYCGQQPYRYHDGDDSGVECQGCNTEARLNVTEWNAAWVWKEIDCLNTLVKLQSEERWSWSEKKTNEVRDLTRAEARMEIEQLKKERDAYRKTLIQTETEWRNKNDWVGEKRPEEIEAWADRVAKRMGGDE